MGVVKSIASTFHEWNELVRSIYTKIIYYELPTNYTNFTNWKGILRTIHEFVEF
jgi:hypothetical protein